MGHRLNLVRMLGISNEHKCPRCGDESSQNFEHYDIECGDPNPSPGRWDLACYCGSCDYEWVVSVHLNELSTLKEMTRALFDLSEEWRSTARKHQTQLAWEGRLLADIFYEFANRLADVMGTYLNNRSVPEDDEG